MRRIVIAVGILLSSTFASAQVCPLYPPEIVKRIDHIGSISGCGGLNAPGCQIGEPVVLSVNPAQGRPFQACDVFLWTLSIEKPRDVVVKTSTPQLEYTFPATWAKGSFGASVSVENGLGSIEAPQATIQFAIPPCDCSKPLPAVLVTYKGTKTGCLPSAGTCAIAEPVAFLALVADNDAQPCDYYRVDYGDGTSPEDIRGFTDSTGAVQPQHFFASVGTFAVTFTIQRSGPTFCSAADATAPSTSVNVRVTSTGQSPPEPTRRRSARH